MKEIHLFVLWENARYQEKEILEDIKKSFNIIGLYQIQWDKENFSKSLSRFYGTNLPKNSGKEQHCGNGAFLLVIVELENPKYEERETSKGIQVVNTDMFDKKTYYRELTGGGHKVHATNSEVETNHDLTLLLGKNIQDYLKELDRNKEVEVIDLEQELLGQNGFKTVKEMFYALNNGIRYAIIRNYETLPDEIYVNEHNDIDIVCDSFENAAYILNAEKVFPEDNRVHYKVKVEDKFAYFDLRYVGDNYYCREMERNILENRTWNEKGFYTISEEEYFYALIYHALLHKPRLAEDYKNRLQKMNRTSEKLETEKDYIKILNQWLFQKGYSITKPIDASVQFNERKARKFDKMLLGNETNDEVIQYIKEYPKEEYASVIEKDKRLEVILALSNIRENIISWYPFKENCTILEIGADLGQITGALCQKATKVVALEFSEEKRKAIAKRHEDSKNLTILRTIEEIEEKFDYITIIGIENSSNFPKEKLKEVKKYLKPDGKILMATDNKLGMKYFSTTDDRENKKLYDYEELQEQIQEAGFTHQKIYYPMTDYQLTNVIYTDKKPLSKNNLARNIVYTEEDTIKFYEQNEAYREILKEDGSNLKTFANSFFIEIFNGEYEENEIRLVAFSNMRKPQYRIKTIMKQNAVYKYPMNTESKEHVKQIKKNIDSMKQANIKTLDSYDEEKIISQYTEAKTLDKVIMELVKEDKNKAIEQIKRFQQELEQKLEEGYKEDNVFKRYGIKYDKEILQDKKFVKYGLWDLIFQNCFYIEDEFYFYDQEWEEDNLPVDFILYRAVKYFDRIKKYISEDELYEILELNQEEIELFHELDDRIQEKIRDEIIWKINTQGKTILDIQREKLTDNHKINILTIENQRKDVEIQELRNELNSIYQSKSWKITKPFRKIKRLGKKK